MGSLRFMNLLAVLCCLDALQDLKFLWNNAVIKQTVNKLHV